MQMNKSVIGLAAALSLMSALTAHAQSAQDVNDLRQEVRKLREELDALKKSGTTPTAAPLEQRVEQAELKQKDAVVAGDIANSFRIPGTETSIHLYGYAEGHAIHDFKQWGAPDNSTNLTFLPLDKDAAPRGRTKFTAEYSRLGFETSTPTQFGPFTAKLEMDFYGYDGSNRNRMRLRHAYGEYAGWLVGQTWSTFMDVDDLPETVDFNGPIGAPFSRRAMIRYTYNDPQLAKFTVALEDPTDQFGGGSSNEKMPQIVARVDKSFDWGAINVRGLAHEKRSPTETRRGYGFGIGGSYKLTDKDLLMLQVARVDGDVDQMYGSNGYAFDSTTGAITFDRNWGFVFGYAKTFSDKLRANFAYGMNRGKVIAAVDNRTLRQAHLNLIYTPFKNIDLGSEIVWGRRSTFSSDVGNMLRLDLMGRYSF